MDIETFEGIRKCPLFEGLTDNEIMDLMHAVRYRVVRLYKSDFLFVAGFPLRTRPQIPRNSSGDDKHEGVANPVDRL